MVQLVGCITLEILLWKIARLVSKDLTILNHASVKLSYELNVSSFI